MLVVATSRSDSSASRASSGAVKWLPVWQRLLYVMSLERKSASVMMCARFTFHRSLPLTSTVSCLLTLQHWNFDK